MKNEKLSELSKAEKRELIYFTTDQKILSELATDPDFYIRELVAKSNYTPVTVLSSLASDKAWCVRLHVIKNSNTPKEVLQKLSKDKDNFLARMAINLLNKRFM